MTRALDILATFLVCLLLLLALPGCQGCGAGSAGKSCQATVDCVDDLICAPDDQGAHRCLIPAGGVCDLNAETTHCVPQTTCQPTASGYSGRCLITLAH